VARHLRSATSTPPATTGGALRPSRPPVLAPAAAARPRRSAAAAEKSPRVRAVGTTIQISRRDVNDIAQRGGRSHRGGGEFSRSAVLHRSLAMLWRVLDLSDPRRTQRLSEEHYQVAVAVLRHRRPWSLTEFEIELLEVLIARAPQLAPLTAERRLDAKDLLAQIASLTFAEKASLVDAAIRAAVDSGAAELVQDPS
jgi:hypothetical protein